MFYTRNGSFLDWLSNKGAWFRNMGAWFRLMVTSIILYFAVAVVAVLWARATHLFRPALIAVFLGAMVAYLCRNAYYDRQLTQWPRPLSLLITIGLSIWAWFQPRTEWTKMAEATPLVNIYLGIVILSSLILFLAEVKRKGQPEPGPDIPDPWD